MSMRREMGMRKASRNQPGMLLPFPLAITAATKPEINETINILCISI
jgi:hypothetical protein